VLTSFKNSVELNNIIDNKLPSLGPTFQSKSFVLDEEVFDVYYRDVIECIKALFSDPEFAPYLKYAPEEPYMDETCTLRLYHDMHTGEWWPATQVNSRVFHLFQHANFPIFQEDLDNIKPGGTIIPIILSSDKTQLTLF
jgi:hypothetical protein